MGVYLANFLVYSMAMVGLLFVCLMVYKKTMVNNKCAKNNEELKVENALNLSPRKTVYVIKAGNEKFLIAADAERTNFLAKLNSQQEIQQYTQKNAAQPQPTEKLPSQKNVDYSEVMNAIKMTKHKQPVMREILRKLDERTVEKNKQQA